MAATAAVQQRALRLPQAPTASSTTASPVISGSQRAEFKEKII